MSDENPQAGWYDDPENAGQLRWWDGERWGDQRRPAPGSGAGAEASAATSAAVPTPAAAGAAGAPVRVDTWLWQSIVATLLCCLPIGIAAIIFSAQAQSAINVGDHAKAREKARLAKTLTIAAVVFGLLFVGVWILVLMAGFAFGSGF